MPFLQILYVRQCQSKSSQEVDFWLILIEGVGLRKEMECISGHSGLYKGKEMKMYPVCLRYTFRRESDMAGMQLA